MKRSGWILAGSVAMLGLCALPYGCSGKTIDGPSGNTDGKAQREGTSITDGASAGDGIVNNPGNHGDGARREGNYADGCVLCGGGKDGGFADGGFADGSFRLPLGDGDDEWADGVADGSSYWGEGSGDGADGTADRPEGATLGEGNEWTPEGVNAND